MRYDRSVIIGALVGAAREAPAVVAMWEIGSAVFGRTDAYSDMDVEVMVRPGQVEAVVGLLRSALGPIAPIATEYRQRTYHGDLQIFWQLEGVSPLNYIDMDIIERRQDRLRLGAHGEGKPIIHFDKCGGLNVAEETRDEMRARVRQRVTEIAGSFGIHPLFVEKQIRRGQVLQAYGQYQRVHDCAADRPAADQALPATVVVADQLHRL